MTEGSSRDERPAATLRDALVTALSLSPLDQETTDAILARWDAEAEMEEDYARELARALAAEDQVERLRAKLGEYDKYVGGFTRHA